MANFAVIVFKTDEGPLASVLTALEVKLETLDTSTNALRLLTVLEVNNDVFVGVIIYNG